MNFTSVRFFIAATAVCTGVLLASCSFLGPSAELKVASRALLDASEKCVYEVRDKGFKYDAAPNCNALGALSQSYINAGGGALNSPVEVEINYERSRVHAWMARALSESSEPALVRIW